MQDVDETLGRFVENTVTECRYWLSKRALLPWVNRQRPILLRVVVGTVFSMNTIQWFWYSAKIHLCCYVESSYATCINHILFSVFSHGCTCRCLSISGRVSKGTSCHDRNYTMNVADRLLVQKEPTKTFCHDWFRDEIQNTVNVCETCHRCYMAALSNFWPSRLQMTSQFSQGIVHTCILWWANHVPIENLQKNLTISLKTAQF